MNLHTFFVHFPIALLMIYALCELVRFQKVLTWPSWFYIKAFLAVTGAGGAVVAYGFGEIAEHAGVYNETVLHTHIFFAALSVVIFGALAASYAAVILDQVRPGLRIPFWGMILGIARFFTGSFVVVPAILGLLAISFTGALGSALVRGPESDFIVSFIFHLFIR